MTARKDFERIVNKARREALAVVTGEIKKVLPDGWRFVIAVGWGVLVFNEDGKTVDGFDAIPMPAKVARVVKLAEDFVDVFGAGNEQIEGNPV